MCLYLSERSQCEKAKHCVVPTQWHSGKGKAVETVTDWWWPRAGVGMKRQRRGFSGHATTPSDTTVVDACHSTFVQIQDVQRQERLKPVDWGWQGCSHVAHQRSTRAPLWQQMWMVRKLHVCGGGAQGAYGNLHFLLLLLKCHKNSDNDKKHPRSLNPQGLWFSALVATSRSRRHRRPSAERTLLTWFENKESWT